MFGLVPSNTPRYAGPGQPQATGGSGVLGSLLSIVRPTLPRYEGRGQPRPLNRGGFLGLFPAQPAYFALPLSTPDDDVDPGPPTGGSGGETERD